MTITIDFESLLKPIDEQEPTGIDPRFSDSRQYYQQLKEARTSARRLEREAILDTESGPEIIEQWQQVITLGTILLADQAKDIEVAAWMIEALTRLNGFSGLADGFTLLRRIIEIYWPAIYPAADEEEGIASKLASITGLNGATSLGALIDPIYCIPIVKKSFGFTTWHYQQAVQAGEPQAVPIEDSVNLTKLEEAAKQSGPVFMQQMKSEIERCAAEFQSLCQLLDNLCGIEHAPPSSNIRNALQACLDAVIQISKTLLPSVVQIPEAEQATDKTEDNSLGNSSINSRQQAFASLLKLAEYFRMHEPNSPVSYLLEQAVRWGNMPLPQLLAELINDQQTLQHSYQLIGVKLTTDI